MREACTERKLASLQLPSWSGPTGSTPSPVRGDRTCPGDEGESETRPRAPKCVRAPAASTESFLLFRQLH